MYQIWPEGLGILRGKRRCRTWKRPSPCLEAHGAGEKHTTGSSCTWPREGGRCSRGAEAGANTRGRCVLRTDGCSGGPLWVPVKARLGGAQGNLPAVFSTWAHLRKGLHRLFKLTGYKGFAWSPPRGRWAPNMGEGLAIDPSNAPGSVGWQGGL